MSVNSILFEHLFISDIYSWDIEGFDGEVSRKILFVNNLYLFKKEIIIKNKRLWLPLEEKKRYIIIKKKNIIYNIILIKIESFQLLIINVLNL